MLPESNKPGQCHGKKYQDTEPELHLDNLFEVALDNEESKNAQSWYYNTDKPLCVEGKSTRNI